MSIIPEYYCLEGLLCLWLKLRCLKGKAIEMITDNLKNRLSIDPEDVFVIINEPPFENWGMSGHQKE